MESLANFDLLSVGVAIAGTVLLGIVAYFTNPHSITNKTFFFFSLTSGLLGLLNYITYQLQSEYLVLWVVRFVMFFAVLFSFFFFLLSYVFPEQKKKFSPLIKYRLIPLVTLTAFLSLTPMVFSGVELTRGEIPRPIPNLGIVIHSVVTLFCVFAGVVILIKKYRKAIGIERARYQPLLFGTVLTFALIIVFNFFFPVFLEDGRFIPLSSFFVFPFIIFTSYAILKHKLFNIKNLTSAILAFLLCLITFIEIIFVNSLNLMIFRVSIFILVLIISIQFIKNIFNLEVANEQKSEFMSFAAHEIRTPLTAVKGYASLILEGDLGAINPQVKDAAQKIMISSNKVIVLITQYLNKSKMELSRLSYSFTVFDLGKLVKEVAQNFQVNAEQKGIILTADIAAGESYNVKADEGKIGEVIGNIIDNAIKYTDKGSVTVSVAKRNGKVTIKIADTGVGILKETIPQLFKKFSRAETQKANFLGTGLGLFLAKTFIDAHKGRVWAESKGQGRGSQFYVELPAENSNIGLTRLAI